MTLPNQEATNNNSSDNDSMTTEFNKNVYQDFAPKQLRSQDLRKQESIRKMSNWVETNARAQSSFHKNILVIAARNFIEVNFRVF